MPCCLALMVGALTYYLVTMPAAAQCGHGLKCPALRSRHQTCCRCCAVQEASWRRASRPSCEWSGGMDWNEVGCTYVNLQRPCLPCSAPVGC